MEEDLITVIEKTHEMVQLSAEMMAQQNEEIKEYVEEVNNLVKTVNKIELERTKERKERKNMKIFIIVMICVTILLLECFFYTCYFPGWICACITVLSVKGVKEIKKD